MRRDQIEQCRKGKAQAVFGLVDEYRDLVAPLVFAVEGANAAEAPETQGKRAVDEAADAFIHVLGELESARGGPAFRPWMRDTVVTLLAPKVRTPDPLLGPADGTPRGPIDDAPVEHLRAAIATLPSELRLPLWAVTAERMTTVQAAPLLGSQVSKVRADVDEALARLRQAVETRARKPLLEDESQVRELVYGQPDSRTRTEIEAASTRDSRMPVTIDALIAERQRIARAFAIEMPTSKILERLRARHRLHRVYIPPVVWIAAQVIIAVAMIAMLIATSGEFRPPTVELTVDSGSATRGEADAVAFEPISVSSNTESSPGAKHVGNWSAGTTLTVGPWSCARASVDGAHHLAFGPGTVVRREESTPEAPMHLMFNGGSMWFDFRGTTADTWIDTPVGRMIPGRTEGWIELQETGLVAVALDGRMPFRLNDGREGVLRSGQGGRFRQNGDAVAGPAPLPELRPLGFSRPAFDDPEAAILAVAPGYVRALIRDETDGLDVRFHWARAGYPLAFDSVPLSVQRLLDAYYADVVDLIDERRRLRRQSDRLALRLQGQQQVAQLARTRMHAVREELRLMMGRQDRLNQLRAEMARTESELLTRIQADADAPWDPAGFDRFALQAQFEATQQRLHALREVEIELLALEAVIEEAGPGLRDARAARDERVRELAAARHEQSEVNAELGTFEDVDDRVAAATVEVENASATRDLLQQRLDTAEAALAEATERADRLQAELDDTRDARAELDAARQRLATAQRQLRDAEQRRADAVAELQAAEQRLLQAQQDERVARTALDDVTNALDALTAEHDRLAADAAPVQEQLAELERVLNAEESRLADALRDRETRANRVSVLERALEVAQARLTQADETLVDAQAHLADQQEARARTAAELDAANEAHDAAIADLRDAQNALSEIPQDVDAQLAAARDTLETHAAAEANAHREANEASEQVVIARQAFDAASDAVAESRTRCETAAATVANAQQRVDELEQRIAELEAQLAAEGLSTDERERLEQELATAQAELAEALQALADAAATLEAEEEQLADRTAVAETAADALSDAESAEQQAFQTVQTATMNASGAASDVERLERLAARAAELRQAVGAAMATVDAVERDQDRLGRLYDSQTVNLQSAGRMTNAALAEQRTAAAAIPPATEHLQQARTELAATEQAVAGQQQETEQAGEALANARRGSATLLGDLDRVTHELADLRQQQRLAEQELQATTRGVEAATVARDEAQQAVLAADPARLAEAVGQAEREMAAAQERLGNGVRDGLQEQLQQARTARQTAQADAARLRTAVDNEAAALADARVRLDAARVAETRRDTLRERLVQVTEAITGHRREIDRLEQRIESLSGDMTPKRERLEELREQYAIKPELERELRAIQDRMTATARYADEIARLRSALHRQRFETRQLEAVAGETVQADRRYELRLHSATVALQRRMLASTRRAHWLVRHALRRFEGGRYEVDLRRRQGELVESLLDIVGGYRDSGLTIADARRVLGAAVADYTRYRVFLESGAGSETVHGFVTEWVGRVQRLLPGASAVRRWNLCPPGEGLADPESGEPDGDNGDDGGDNGSGASPDDPDGAPSDDDESN